MTDGLRKSHLRKAPQVGLSEVGLPEGNHRIAVIQYDNCFYADSGRDKRVLWTTALNY